MPLISQRRPPKAEIRHYKRRQLIATELKPVAKTAEKSRDKIVADWDNKPKFQATISVKPALIEIVTVVRRGQRLKNGSNATTADLWKWIDKTGTRPHVITVKNARALYFRTGYKSKTGANPARYGGPGTATGEAVFTRQVQHPGFEPRHFSDVIDKDLLNEFREAIERARQKANRLGY